MHILRPPLHTWKDVLTISVSWIQKKRGVVKSIGNGPMGLVPKIQYYKHFWIEWEALCRYVPTYIWKMLECIKRGWMLQGGYFVKSACNFTKDSLNTKIIDWKLKIRDKSQNIKIAYSLDRLWSFGLYLIPSNIPAMFCFSY